MHETTNASLDPGKKALLFASLDFTRGVIAKFQTKELDTKCEKKILGREKCEGN